MIVIDPLNTPRCCTSKRLRGSDGALADLAGFEPASSRLTVGCSTVKLQANGAVTDADMAEPPTSGRYTHPHLLQQGPARSQQADRRGNHS